MKKEKKTKLSHGVFFPDKKKRRSSKKEIDDFFFNLFKEECYSKMEKILLEEDMIRPTEDQVVQALRVAYPLVKDSRIGDQVREGLKTIAKSSTK